MFILLLIWNMWAFIVMAAGMGHFFTNHTVIHEVITIFFFLVKKKDEHCEYLMYICYHIHLSKQLYWRQTALIRLPNTYGISIWRMSVLGIITACVNYLRYNWVYMIICLIFIMFMLPPTLKSVMLKHAFTKLIYLLTSVLRMCLGHTRMIVSNSEIVEYKACVGLWFFTQQG